MRSEVFLTPIRADGARLPTSVVKIDVAEEIEREVAKTATYGPMFGLLHPNVMDMKKSARLAAMQLELCGGLHGLADLALGIQVQSFADRVHKRKQRFDH